MISGHKLKRIAQLTWYSIGVYISVFASQTIIVIHQHRLLGKPNLAFDMFMGMMDHMTLCTASLIVLS